MLITFLAAMKWLFILLGHLAISCVLFNHVHAYAAPFLVGPQSRKITEKLIALFAVLPIPWMLYVCLIYGPTAAIQIPRPLSLYFYLAKLVGFYFLLRWVYRTITRKLPADAVHIEKNLIDVGREVGKPLLHGWKAKLLGAIPGNQVTKLATHHWELSFQDLPEDLEGFRICQLSDLHFTGLIGPEYFDRVVDEANGAKPDLVVITGDIIDSNECLDWIEMVLARLTATYGVYYVLGNHDCLIKDLESYRARLRGAGLVAAAGKWHCLNVGNSQVLLTGNALPWFVEANQLAARPASNTKEGENNQNGKDKCDFDFSILLSHSPDQIGWAVQRNIDLMFAGHTHGGQIRLPVVGPIIAPSHYGIKYASGTFQVRKTMMHVSRGVSGDEPIRLNCPPELGFFTLRKG